MSGYRFENKVALVTGAGSGIGRVASRRFAAEGAAVVIVDIDPDRAAATVALIETSGGRAVAVTADVADEAASLAMFDTACATFGGVDMAFLNAGVCQPYMRFREVTVGVLDTMVRVNLRGAFLGMQMALTRLRPDGACLVTASMAGLLGFSEVAAYSASKHGVVGLVKAAARDFAERKLRVNALCPGLVLTPMTGHAQDDSLVENLPTPDYRGGMTAQHLAEVALFLLSRDAAGINGHAQLVDAATLAAYPPLEL